MDYDRFDRLARGLAAGASRRGMVRQLSGAAIGGVLAAVMGGAFAANGTDARKKKKKKRCRAGLLKCTIKRRKNRTKTFCVDARNDPANCGGCGLTCESSQTCQDGTCTCDGTLCAGCCAGAACQAGNTIQQCGTNGAVCETCGGGNACNTPTCDQGVCGTTPTPGVACNGGSGTCDAAGRCVATVCAGKNAANPCFPFDAGTCNTGGSTCRCGSDLAGNVACFENAYCLSVAEGNCASNADCVAKGFPQGSICFSAPDCCLSQFGCTTPCPT